jgi:hypothetical protein
MDRVIKNRPIYTISKATIILEGLYQEPYFLTMSILHITGLNQWHFLRKLRSHHSQAAPQILARYGLHSRDGGYYSS